VKPIVRPDDLADPARAHDLPALREGLL